MNRPIKFRAWDTVNKRFSFFKLIPLAYGQAKLIEESHQFVSATFSTEDSILTQFTGLHDKNGKEIWEGDIIKSERTGNKYLVAWEKEKACFMLWFKDFDETPYNFLHNECNGLVQSEVLGNIYSNPELVPNNNQS